MRVKSEAIAPARVQSRLRTYLKILIIINHRFDGRRKKKKREREREKEREERKKKIRKKNVILAMRKKRVKYEPRRREKGG